MMEDLGVPLARRWDSALIENPREIAQRLEAGSDLESRVAARHLASSLTRMPAKESVIVLVLNPAERSPAAREATRLGAEVYMLPRRRTTLPSNAGVVVPWRRAIDLAPLLVAVKSADANRWRQEYRKLAPVHNRRVTERRIEDWDFDLPEADPLLRNPIDSVAERIQSLDPVVTVIRDTPIESVHEGGRLTLASLRMGAGPTSTLESWQEKIEVLGISPTQLNDPHEWVVGGRMIRRDRALQVTRSYSEDQLNVQLVWGGPDPSPGEIVRIESELQERLRPN